MSCRADLDEGHTEDRDGVLEEEQRPNNHDHYKMDRRRAASRLQGCRFVYWYIW